MLWAALVCLLAATSAGAISSQPAAAQSLPVITVTGGDAITEGGLAKFTLTASPAPTKGIFVNFTLEDAPGADFLWNSSEGPGLSYFTKGMTTDLLYIRTVADSTEEPSGPLTVTVNPGSGYTVGSASSAMVNVMDDYETELARNIYRVGLWGPASSSVVREGESVVITASLNRPNATGSPIVVPLNVAQSSADITVASSISIPDGDSTATTTVAVVDDQDPEEYERVSIRLGRFWQPNVAERRDRRGREVAFFIRYSDVPDLGRLLFRVCEAENNNCPLDGDEGWVETSSPSITLIEGGDPVSYQYKLSATETPFRATSVYPRFEWNGTWNGFPSGPVNNDRRDCEASSAHAQVPRIDNGYPRKWHSRCPHQGNAVGGNKRNDWHTVTFSAGEDIDAYNHSAVVYHDTVVVGLGWLGDLRRSYYADPTGRRWPVKVTVLDNDEWDQDFEFSADGITWTAIRDGGGVKQMLPDVLIPGETYQFHVRLRDRDEGTRSVDVLTLDVESHLWTVTLTEGSDDPWSGYFEADFRGNAAKVFTINVDVADDAKPGNVIIEEDTRNGFYMRAGIERLKYESHYWYGTAACIGCTPVSVSQSLPSSVPEVSIAAVGDVAEGAAAEFTVTAIPAPKADLDIKVTVAASGDYGATTGTRTVTIPTTGSSTLSVATSGDDDDESDGSVTVTLVDGADYDLGTATTATVNIADDDDVGTSESTTLDVVDDGDSLPDYTVYQTVVDYLVEVRDNPVNTAVRGHPVHIRKWNQVLAAIGYPSSVAPMAVSVIHANTAKWPHSPFKAASEYLNSHQQQPEITVSAGNDVSEGTAAVFTVTATPPPAADLDVTVTVSASGDYGAATGRRTVTIPTTGSMTLSVATTGDSTDEADGSVTATLVDGSAYDLGTSNTATVTVSDDDDPPPPPPPTPMVTISGGSGITEGGSASFTLTVSPASAVDLDVTVTVAQSGDYGATIGRRTVTISAGSTTATFTIGTTGDSTDEPDGSVTATLVDGADYDLGTSNTATVTVADDDPPPPTPVVTISGGSGVTEGSNASFTLTATPAPTSPINVTVTVTASGDYGATTGSRTVTVPTTGSATFTVATTGDSTDELDGSVTATLADGADYDLGTSNTATVTVADDDPPPPPPLDDSVEAVLTDCGDTAPTLSISSPTASRSDATVDFEVSLDCLPARGQTILLAPVRDGVQGSYIFVSLSGEQPSATITVPIRDAHELSLVIGWSSGLANSEAQGNVAFTD